MKQILLHVGHRAFELIWFNRKKWVSLLWRIFLMHSKSFSLFNSYSQFSTVFSFLFCKLLNLHENILLFRCYFWMFYLKIKQNGAFFRRNYDFHYKEQNVLFADKISFFFTSKRLTHAGFDIQWVEKLSVHPLWLFSFLLFYLIETNLGAPISNIL